MPKQGKSYSKIQNEHAFQKQPTVFVGVRSAIKAQRATKATRYFKSIGLGYRVPREATEGDYVDKKCPFTGNVSIRGRILRGTVIKTHMKRSVIIRRDYLHYIPKYKRFEKRHKNIAVHVSPCFRVAVGDVIEVGECRPLSKTIRFNMLKMVKPGPESSETFSKF